MRRTLEKISLCQGKAQWLPLVLGRERRPKRQVQFCWQGSQPERNLFIRHRRLLQRALRQSHAVPINRHTDPGTTSNKRTTYSSSSAAGRAAHGITADSSGATTTNATKANDGSI